MAKNKIFSGQKLSDKERKSIEDQLKKSRERDIRSMKESEEKRKARTAKTRGRRFTNRYREGGFSGAKTGKEAEKKWILMKKALSKEVTADLYEEYESGDILEAADYIADNYVPGEKGTYFNKQDMIDAIKMLRDQGYDILDENDIIF